MLDSEDQRERCLQDYVGLLEVVEARPIENEIASFPRFSVFPALLQPASFARLCETSQGYLSLPQNRINLRMTNIPNKHSELNTFAGEFSVSDGRLAPSLSKPISDLDRGLEIEALASAIQFDCVYFLEVIRP